MTDQKLTWKNERRKLGDLEGWELNPRYVAVTIERWHEATGEFPELVKPE